MLRVGVLLFSDVEELDFVGPWEVFTMANACGLPFEAFTVSQMGGRVKCKKGLTVVADHSFETAASPDILVVPGGQGTRREVDNDNLTDWVRQAGGKAQWVTSVCTGAFLIGKAGLTVGKAVTTHWASIERLRESGFARQVVDDRRVVRDGNVITSAGVSAGIDMALALVGDIGGTEKAAEVQKWMEYFPEPALKLA